MKIIQENYDYLVEDSQHEIIGEGKFSDLIHGIGDKATASAEKAGERATARRQTTGKVLHKVADAVDNVGEKIKDSAANKREVNYTVTVTDKDRSKWASSTSKRKGFRKYDDAAKYAQKLSWNLKDGQLAVITDLDYGTYNAYQKGEKVNGNINPSTVKNGEAPKETDKGEKKPPTRPESPKPSEKKRFSVNVELDNKFVPTDRSFDEEELLSADELCCSYSRIAGKRVLLYDSESKKYNIYSKGVRKINDIGIEDKSSEEKKEKPVEDEKKPAGNEKDVEDDTEYSSWDDHDKWGVKSEKYAKVVTMKRINESEEFRYDFVLNKRKNDYDEYLVKAYKNGKYSEDATYYTDDWEDAEGTFLALVKQYGLEYRKTDTGYTTKNIVESLTEDYDDERAVEDVGSAIGDYEEAELGLKSGDIEYYSGIDDSYELGEIYIDRHYDSDPLTLEKDILKKCFDFAELGRDSKKQKYRLKTNRIKGVHVDVYNITYYDLTTNEYEESEDLQYDLETEDFNLGDDVNERVVRQFIDELLAERFGCDEEDLSYDIDCDIIWDDVVSAGEYLCGDEMATDYEIGWKIIENCGYDDKNIDFYDYFRYDWFIDNYLAEKYDVIRTENGYAIIYR